MDHFAAVVEVAPEEQLGRRRRTEKFGDSRADAADGSAPYRQRHHAREDRERNDAGREAEGRALEERFHRMVRLEGRPPAMGERPLTFFLSLADRNRAERDRKPLRHNRGVAAAHRNCRR